MEEKNEKSKKFYKSITNIVKVTWSRGSSQNSQGNCKCNKDEPTRCDDVGGRNRSQGIYRTIKKKLKQNRLFKSKKVSTIESDCLQRAYTANLQTDEMNNTPPEPPPRTPRIMTNNDLDDNENQYLDISELNQNSSNQESPSRSSDDSNGSLGREHFNLAKFGWFWGPITKREAESKLSDQPDGAFLIRDSSSDRYVFTLSFKSYGQTLHSHIEYSRGVYSMGDHLSKSSVAELIETAIDISKEGVFSYSRSKNVTDPAYPVRLTVPISRFTDVRSLQYLCRFVIRQYINVNNIPELPIPTTLKGYLQQGQY